MSWRSLAFQPVSLPVAIAAAGIALSAGLAWQVHVDIQRQAATEFDRLTHQVQLEVEQRFTQPLYGLRGARGTYAASHEIRRAEFRAYVASREMAVEFPGVRGFGFIAHTRAADDAAFVATERADDAPDFVVREFAPTPHADRYVIKYIEPLADNAPALGLDVGSEPVRRAAIERAIDSGAATLTPPIVLVQDGRRTPGFLLYQPIYRERLTTADAAARRAALVGVLYAPIVAAELLERPAAEVADRLHFALRAGNVPVFSGPQTAPAGARSTSVPLVVGGLSMTLDARSTPGFDAASRRDTAPLVLTGGLLLTALLSVLAYFNSAGRHRAEAIARRMTRDLDRLAMVARRTSDAVAMLDVAHRVTWVNASFERLTGFTADEAVGRTQAQLLGTRAEHAADAADLQRALAHGGVFRGELCQRRSDGSDYWVELELQPLRDGDGVLSGFMTVESDITARRQAESALAAAVRDNEAILSTLNAHTIVSVTDADGRIVDVNPAFCKATGYARDELIGRTHQRIASGVHPPEFWRAMWQRIATGSPWRAAVCNRAKDGTLRWMDSIVAPFTGADGRIERYISIRTDITDTRLAADELARERERLALIIEGTDAGTWEVDLTTGVDVVNPTYAAMLGDTMASLRQRMPRGSFLDLVHERDRETVQRAQRAHFDQPSVPYAVEFRMRHRSGRWVWILSRGRVSTRDAQGRPLRMSGIHLDITERKHAERALSRERMRLRNILEGTHVGTWEWNVQTGETVFNERWAEIVGQSLAALAPVSIATWEALCHPDDRAVSQAALQRHFDGAADYYECELRMRHQDGHWVWVLDRGRLYSRTEDGRPRWMAGTRMDITARKLAEQALRDSRAFLDTTGRIAGVGGWMFDLTTMQVTWSDETCRLHEMPPGHAPTIEEALSFYEPEHRARIETAARRCIETGEAFDVEVPLTGAYGRRVWLRLIGQTESADGGACRLIGAMQDVTSRREMEDELRRTGEVMTSIVENLPCGVSVFDANLELVASNRKYREVLGFPDALFAVPRPRFESFIRYNAERGEYGDGDVDTLVARAVERARGPTIAHRFERLRADGTPIEVQGVPMPGGGFVTTYTDISDRRRAEREIERSAALLRGAIDAVDEAFVLYGPDDRLVFCNEKYRDIYAASRDLIVPGATFESIVRAGARRGQYPEAEGRLEDWVAERLAQHRGGDSRLVQQLDDGRVVRVIERRMADGHTVGFRIDITDLVRASQAAQEASLAKSQFLANMSHEIRTPMNAILGMLKLLRRTALDARQDDYAAKTEGAARSLLGLLNDILDFSKAEAGKMVLDPQPFRPDELLRDLSVILSATVGGKPVEVLFDVDPALPPRLLGDALRLQQVLINLAGNAIKFTERGEVVLSVHVDGRAAGTVTLAVAVRDTGIGIAPEHQARIFSGFTQAEASTTRRYGGTGLGVAISQRLVRLMGGELQLDSTPGEGSRFHFRVALPVVVEDGDATPPAAAAEADVDAAPAPRRVLIVDDNPVARELIGAMASSLGWRPELAADGADALARLRAADGGAPFDAVFVDWQMPGLDGWQTCERIRADAAPGRRVPLLVMVTAQGRESLAQRSVHDQQLLDGFLVKPVTASMLAQAIGDASARAGATPGAPGPAARRLQGLRLLVAEDNPINQQVTRELLEDEGAEVHLVSNGQAAVDAVAADESAFDVVLMDLQMPVMDGYVATSRIRRSLGRLSLPIVAMTANAMASDREACLAAGMNDHVGKPFDLDHLVGVLRRCCVRDPGASSAPPAGTPPSRSRATLGEATLAALAPLAAAAEIDLEAAVGRLGGRLDTWRRLLGRFVDELDAHAESLEAGVRDGRFDDAARLAHTLKGLAGTLGAAALARTAADVERALKMPGEDTASPSALVQASEPLRRALVAAAPALQALCEGIDAAARTGDAPRAGAAAAAAVAAALGPALRRLETLLADADMDALAAMDTLRELGAPAGLHLERLDAAVAALEFDRALAVCGEWLKEIEA